MEHRSRAFHDRDLDPRVATLETGQLHRPHLCAEIALGRVELAHVLDRFGVCRLVEHSRRVHLERRWRLSAALGRAAEADAVHHRRVDRIHDAAAGEVLVEVALDLLSEVVRLEVRRARERQLDDVDLATRRDVDHEPSGAFALARRAKHAGARVEEAVSPKRVDDALVNRVDHRIRERLLAGVDGALEVAALERLDAVQDERVPGPRVRRDGHDRATPSHHRHGGAELGLEPAELAHPRLGAVYRLLDLPAIEHVTDVEVERLATRRSRAVACRLRTAGGRFASAHPRSPRAAAPCAPGRRCRARSASRASDRTRAHGTRRSWPSSPIRACARAARRPRRAPRSVRSSASSISSLPLTSTRASRTRGVR